MRGWDGESLSENGIDSVSLCSGDGIESVYERMGWRDEHLPC